MLSFVPLLARAKRRLGLNPRLLERAEELVEVEPASVFQCAPAISLPDELARVKAFEGDKAGQIERLAERQRSEGPTRSYLFRNALLADFSVYARGAHEVYRSGMKRPFLLGAPDRFDEAQLCTTSGVESFFGHFLREELPLELLAERRSMIPLVFDRRPWPHEPGYRELLAVHPVTTSFARVSKLWITDERSLNAGWVSRYSELRDRLRLNAQPTSDRRIFLRRGAAGSARTLINEDALVEQLEANGFRIIAPEGQTPIEIASALSGAEVVACVEGSAQQHALIAMPAGATLLSIQPPYRFNTIAKVIANRIGVTFAFTVAEPVEGGFTIGIDRLLKTLDLVR